MIGDIELRVIFDYLDNNKYENEVIENIATSTHGRYGARGLDKVFSHINGSCFLLKYRVRSEGKGSFLCKTFVEAVDEYNKL